MIPEIIYPGGAGGNHVRWLLSIDPRVNLRFFKGSVDEKVNWICQKIYKDRTWSNWLEIEWQYRNYFDSIIKIEHEAFQGYERIDDPVWQSRKQLFLTVDDYMMTAYHYFMINIKSSSIVKHHAAGDFKRWDDQLTLFKNSNLANKQILKSDCIVEPTLNLDWYKKIIDWAGFDNLYEQACQVHAAYYQCRQQSAKDFIKYFEGDEFKSHLDFYKNKYINTKDLL